jgi:S1-C subfamily serine protease
VLAGDLILKLGEIEIKDIYVYMEALGKFKKGDKTQVEFKRGSEILKRDIEF